MPTAEHVYYPSCVVNLEIVFDEALLASVTPGAPISTEEAADSIAGARVADTAPRVIAASTVPNAPYTGDKAPVFVMNRVPKRCNVEMPSSRQAASFDISLDFRDLPIDPRTVRAVSVEIHMGVLTPDNFAEGMSRIAADGSRRSILRTRDDKNNPNDRTILLVGIADEWDVEYGESGAEISIKGRDLRGLFLDSPLTMREMNKLDMSRPLDGVIGDLLHMHPAGERIEIVVDPTEWPKSRVPAAMPSNLVPRHRRGARGRRGGGHAAPPGGGEMTYWDAIVRMCYLVGAIPFFAGRELHIRPALGYFDQLSNGLGPATRTPFDPNRPRKADGVPPWTVRRMVYGRNISSLKFNRKYGGSQKPKVVRCVSVDHTSSGSDGRIIEARWPPTPPPAPRNTGAATPTPRPRVPPPSAPLSRQVEAAARNRVAPSGGQSQTDLLNVPVYGVRDRERLLTIAQALFNEIGRNEMGGTCESKDLSSFGAGNEDPDLLRLRPGDAVEFYFDGNLRGAANPNDAADHFRQPFAQELREITERIGSERMARAILATSRGSIQRIQNFFRVSSVNYTWALEGLNVSFEFQNYFVVRNDLLGAETNQLLRGEQASSPGKRTSVPDRRPRPTSTPVPRRRDMSDRPTEEQGVMEALLRARGRR